MIRTGFFLGEYKYRLDESYRLALPKRIRAEIETPELVLTRGFEACIAGFDMKKWQKMAAEPLAIPFFEEKSRQLRRQLFSGANIIELTSQGRIVLPESLVEWAGLTGKAGQEIVIVGAGEHFEIWNSENWEKQMRT